MNSETLFVFADNMLSNISKVELTERAKKIWAAANKDSSLQKKKVSAGVVRVQSK